MTAYRIAKPGLLNPTDVEALDRPIVDSYYVPDHFVLQEVAVQVAHLIASVNIAALHSLSPDDIVVHGRKSALHVANIEPVVYALKQFDLTKHLIGHH